MFGDKKPSFLGLNKSITYNPYMQFLLHLFVLFGILSTPICIPLLGCTPVGIRGYSAPGFGPPLQRMSSYHIGLHIGRAHEVIVRIFVYLLVVIFCLLYPRLALYPCLLLLEIRVCRTYTPLPQQKSWSHILGKSLSQLRLPVYVFRVYAIVYANHGLGHRFRVFLRSCRNPTPKKTYLLLDDLHDKSSGDIEQARLLLDIVLCSQLLACQSLLSTIPRI